MPFLGEDEPFAAPVVPFVEEEEGKTLTAVACRLAEGGWKKLEVGRFWDADTEPLLCVFGGFEEGEEAVGCVWDGGCELSMI